jgi:hypothetical protein
MQVTVVQFLRPNVSVLGKYHHPIQETASDYQVVLVEEVGLFHFVGDTICHYADKMLHPTNALSDHLAQSMIGI